MLVKTFQAPTMAEALRQVKAELGSDAMILSTKKEKQGGFLGFFSKEVVKVTAAIDPNRPVSAPATPPVRERHEREKTTKEEFENSMLAPLARELKDLRDKVEQLSRHEGSSRKGSISSSGTDTTSRQPDNGSGISSIPRQELDEIKKLLLNTLSKNQDDNGVKTVQWPDAAVNSSVQTKDSAEPDVKSNLVTELERQGILPELQRKILDAVSSSVPAGDVTAAEPDKGRLSEVFNRIIKFAGTLKMKKNEPKIITLIGPTGVGKTTTTAKLAAMYALNRGNKVALITMDIFRVGAVEQLKTYTRIMGIPLEVASTGKELERALERHRECDLVLIDTAGRSHKDTEKLEEMKEVLENTVESEIYLCLSATTKDRELEEILNRFSIFPISKMVFTKLDECESFGCIVNLLLKTNQQIAYFTTGQRVPEDIEVATSDKLAELILKEGCLE